MASRPPIPAPPTDLVLEQPADQPPTKSNKGIVLILVGILLTLLGILYVTIVRLEAAVRDVETAVAAIPQPDVSGLEAAMRDVETLLTALEDIRDTLNQSTDYQQLPPHRPDVWLEEDSFGRIWLYWHVPPTDDRLPITEFRIRQHRPDVSIGFSEIAVNSTTGGVDVTDRGDLYAHEPGYEYTIVACNYQQRCGQESLPAS